MNPMVCAFRGKSRNQGGDVSYDLFSNKRKTQAFNIALHTASPQSLAKDRNLWYGCRACGVVSYAVSKVGFCGPFTCLEDVRMQDKGFLPRPMLDLTFKALFGRETNKNLLLSLLNAVLERPGFVPLVEVTLQNPALDYEVIGEKHPLLDVKARDEKGRIFNVEVQLAEQKTFPQRLLYYWSKIYAHQLAEGEHYVKLRPTISVAFLDFALDEREGYSRRVVAWDETHHLIFSEHLEMVLFELPKFSLELGEEIPSKRERWLYFLKEAKSMSAELLEQWKTPEIEQAIKELKKLSQDPQWRTSYLDREKALRDYISIMAEKFEDGWEKGMEKGMEASKLLFVRRLLAKGMEKKEIAELVGITEEEVAKLEATEG